MQPLITSNLKLRQGADFSQIMRYGCGPFVYRAITGAAKAAPLNLTVVGHGIVPDSWPIVIAGVLGMHEINAATKPPLPPRPEDYVIATAAGADHLVVNTINAAGFCEYESGGTIQYPTPFDLTGYTARAQVRSSYGAEATLLDLTSANGGIVLDIPNATIEIVVTSTQTAAIDWWTGVYDLELVSPGGFVTPFAQGTVSVSREVTR